MLLDILRKTWPLFLGMAFLMLGNGLQGTLISWRAAYEGFGSSTTGLIMTGFYTGFLAGSLVTQILVQQVGHIRVFAALASLASTAVLIQIVFVNAPVWFLMRLLTGFCFAGAYVIVESWLNARSDNASRGRTLSFYMLVSYSGMAGGQWLMKLSDPATATLFILSSILLSIALVPILISRTQAPEIQTQEAMSVRKLYRRAPSGLATILVGSIAHSAMFGMGAVYAVEAGMDVSQIVVFMSVFIAMGALSQWPVGWLSDRVDRRWVVMGAATLSVGMCMVLVNMRIDQRFFFLAYGALGAMTLPLYSISVAHVNDRLKPEQMASASGTIVLVMGIGAILGPISAGTLIRVLGAEGYYYHIAAVHGVIMLLVLYSLIQRDAVPEEDQVQYQAVPARPTVVALEAVAQEAEESMGNEEDETTPHGADETAN